MRTKINYTLLSLLVALFITSMASCKTEKPYEPTKPIKVGKGQTTLTDVEVGFHQVKYLLQGGDGSYRAVSADSKIAEVKVEKDSLIVVGKKEGSTYATITSHNFKQRLNIKVVFPKLSFSQAELTLPPDANEENRSVRLDGGGLTPKLTVAPEGVVNVTWDSKSNELIIKALRVGNAIITASDEFNREATLLIKVRPDGEPTKFAIFGTDKRNLEHAYKLNTIFVSELPNGGFILSNGYKPKKIEDTFIGSSRQTSVVAIAPINEPEEENLT